MITIKAGRHIFDGTKQCTDIGVAEFCYALLETWAVTQVVVLMNGQEVARFA